MDNAQDFCLNLALPASPGLEGLEGLEILEGCSDEELASADEADEAALVDGFIRQAHHRLKAIHVDISSSDFGSSDDD